jgi:hypothetical protein
MNAGTMGIPGSSSSLHIPSVHATQTLDLCLKIVPERGAPAVFSDLLSCAGEYLFQVMPWNR